MSGKPLIVFDLDGTLVDTAPDLLATLNVILERAGYSAVPADQISYLVGQGARKMLERGLRYHEAPFTEQELDDLFEQFIAYYSAHIADNSVPFPGVLEAMDRLSDRGYSFAVCTNKIETLSRALLTELSLIERFDVIAGRDTFPVCKPDPEHLLATIRAAHGDPARAIMIGDSKTDIHTAQAANIPVIAVTFGYTDIPVQELAPDRIIDHFDQLVTAVDTLVG